MTIINIRHSWLNTLLQPWKLALKTVYKGSIYRCNICENNFKKLLPVNISQRTNALCPYCRSTEADRTIWFYLTNEVIGLKNKSRFLYVDPHPILLKKLKQNNIQVEVLDKSYFNHEIYRNHKVQGGIYDVIIFSHQLQYMKNDEACLEELKRLLRTGGIALIQTIVHPEMDRTYEHINTSDDRDRLKEYYEPGIESVYGVNFHKHLKKAEFKIEIIDFAQLLGESATQYYCLGNGDREKIYKCKKPQK
jgi:SAM-dependent methyltransferase